jgi:hypothetical protein
LDVLKGAGEVLKLSKLLGGALILCLMETKTINNEKTIDGSMEDETSG